MTTPIANLPACPAAPASLEISEPGTLGSSSARAAKPRARWPNRVTAKTGCLLTHGQRVVSAEASVMANGVKVGSKKLVTALVKQFCP